jgi:hypothetical protein
MTVISLAMPARALAYRRTTVDGAPDRGLFWADRTIPIELASTSSTDVAPADLHASLLRSLATWSDPDCSDIQLTDAGEALGLGTNLVDGRRDGLNRVVVRQTDWPEDVGPETLALTTIAYDVPTGRILDADIDLNATTHRFTVVDPPPPDADDLENTLTHETGHLLGFAHVSDPEATMFVSAELAETLKRDLAADDLLALCETYGTGRETPRLPSPAAAASCSASPGRRGEPGVLLVLCVIARAARRSRRRARAAGTAS